MSGDAGQWCSSSHNVLRENDATVNIYTGLQGVMGRLGQGLKLQCRTFEFKYRDPLEPAEKERKANSGGFWGKLFSSAGSSTPAASSNSSGDGSEGRSTGTDEEAAQEGEVIFGCAEVVHGDPTEPQLLEATFDPKSLEVVGLTSVADPTQLLIDSEQTYGRNEFAKIEAKVQGPKILDTDRYPGPIRFTVEKQNRALVEGRLEMRGHRPLILCTREDTDTHFVAKCPLRHSDFGMKPAGFGRYLFAAAEEILVEVRIPKVAPGLL